MTGLLLRAPRLANITNASPARRRIQGMVCLHRCSQQRLFHHGDFLGDARLRAFWSDHAGLKSLVGRSTGNSAVFAIIDPPTERLPAQSAEAAPAPQPRLPLPIYVSTQQLGLSRMLAVTPASQFVN